MRNTANSIGAANESSLHRFLKYRYAGQEGSTETRIDGFVCDGQTGEGEIIEVQTGSFGPLKKKLTALAAENKIRVIHPVVINKYIELCDAEGRILRRRQSPRKGSAWDLFKNLLYAPELPLLRNLTIELALIDLVEKRIADGTGSWRRKGARIADKSLVAWHESLVLKDLKDYFRFIPFQKNETFTVKTLGEKVRINSGLAGKCLYVLHKMRLVERTGKTGNAYIYAITDEAVKTARDARKKKARNSSRPVSHKK